MEPIFYTQPRRFAVVATARMVAKAHNSEVVNPLACVASDVDTDLQLSGPSLSGHYFGNIGLKPENQSAKRKRTPSKRKRNDELA